MCTASWHWDESTCLLWFSRDERRSRPRAEPPSVHQSPRTAKQGTNTAPSQFLAPIDPQGGGTWIWLNEHGLAACLLNDYSAEATPTLTSSKPSSQAPRQSRGQLMLQLAASKSARAFEQTLNQVWAQNHFAGCHLLLFSLKHPPRYWHCQSGQLPQSQSLPKIGHFTSSSWREAEVRQARAKRFAQLIPADSAQLEQSQFERLHRDRDPLGASWSILMDREPSTTHSLSHICLEASQASLRYQDRLGSLSHFCQDTLDAAADFAPAHSLAFTS